MQTTEVSYTAAWCKAYICLKSMVQNFEWMKSIILLVVLIKHLIYFNIDVIESDLLGVAFN